MSDLVGRLSVLQVLLAGRHPDHHATVCEAIAEVRRLRCESSDVFECADGTVAKDATVAAQTWADECRRLREREAKAREILQAHSAEYVRTDTDEGVARAAERVAIWMDAARWLAEGE